jgi:hypothetical protein
MNMGMMQMQMAGAQQGPHHHQNNGMSSLQMQMMQQQMMQQQTPNMQPMAMNQNNYSGNPVSYYSPNEPIQATAVPSSTERNTTHIANEIEKLATLRDRGLMTEQEYADAKSKLLAKL